VDGPVESVAAYLSGHHRQIALLLDGVDLEADVLADELAVAPASDRVVPDNSLPESSMTPPSANAARNASVSFAFAEASSAATRAGADSSMAVVVIGESSVGG